MLAGAGSTLRMSGWMTGTTLVAAALRETFHIGPRFEDSPPFAQYTMPTISAMSGLLTARLVTGSLSPLARRSALWLSLGAGVLLPDLLGATAPDVRRTLRRLAGEAEQ